MANVTPIPEGYETIIPYLSVNDGTAAIEFYKKAFGATEVMRFPDPSGKIAHAEIQIGSSRIMLSDEHPERGYRSPKSLGGSGTGIMLYLSDVDVVFKRAVDAGAKAQQPVTDQFYGDRSGNLIDPFGHLWTVATHVEDVPPEEMQRRMEAAMRATATT